jgi:hypothetical protein
MIMHKPSQIHLPPAIIGPDYDEGPLRKRMKKICCSIHQPKYSPIPRFPCFPCLPSGGLQHPPANLRSSIPCTITIVQKQQRAKVKDCSMIETESSSNVLIKRKRASSSTRKSPQSNMPLVKPRPLCAPPKIPSSLSSTILPLGIPLAVAPSLPRLAAGRAFPKLSVQ